MGLNVFFPNVVFKSVRKPLGNENEFLLSAALGFPEDQSPIMDIRKG